MELNDIKTLIEFDQEKMQAVIDVHNKKEMTLKAIALEKEEISKSTWDEVNLKVAQTKKELDEKITKDAKANEAEYLKVSAAIKETFQNKKEEWKEELFRRTIK